MLNFTVCEFYLYKKTQENQVKWSMPVIPTILKVEIDGENCGLRLACGGEQEVVSQTSSPQTSQVW
jgi:hypothetical protein